MEWPGVQWSGDQIRCMETDRGGGGQYVGPRGGDWKHRGLCVGWGWDLCFIRIPQAVWLQRLGSRALLLGQEWLGDGDKPLNPSINPRTPVLVREEWIFSC